MRFPFRIAPVHFPAVRKAVIDVGSNSVLLLVEELQDGRWETVHETTNVSSLGEGTKQTGLLSEAGIVRTLTALQEAFTAARDLGATEILAGVTMAARIASNAEDFLSRAEAQGTPVFVLTGEQEAELGFQAVATDPLFVDYERISIIDVGGQSTELVTAHKFAGRYNVLYRESFPVGTLALRSGLLSDESPDKMSLLRSVRQIDEIIGLVYLPGQAGHAVALGATGTNLVSIRERMNGWEPEKVHGAYLDYEEVSQAVSNMCGMIDAERAAIIGMEPGREKTLHIGALILERFLHAIKVLGTSVSVRGWRHALLENGLPAGTQK